MSGIIDLLFILLVVVYGATFVFDLPYRLGINKLASLFFFGILSGMLWLWPRPENVFHSDWYSNFWGGMYLLDSELNPVIFRTAICIIGIFIFAVSRSARCLAGRIPLSGAVVPAMAAGPVKPSIQKKAAARRAYSQVGCKGLAIYYSWNLNGGGLVYAPELVRVVSQRVGKVGHIFEYCAGPGFIGFSLLAHNLCDRLTLADINPDAVSAVRETIRRNRLEERVTVYQSDCLEEIPSGERWDLVVSNPPWRLAQEDSANRRVCDPQSRVHVNFYLKVRDHLNPGGQVLFFEGGEFTEPDCFRGMIQQGGLELVESFRAVSFFELGARLKDYAGLSLWQALFVRWSLFVREAYFILSRKKA